MTLGRAAALALVAAALLTGCSRKPTTDQVLKFSIVPAEDQASMGRVWQPLLDDLQKQTGLKVEASFASNYMGMIEAMRFNQVQVGWFSALPALEAVNRAHAEVLGRIVDKGGEAGVYESVLITRKGSGITLDKLLKCGKRYNFGLGDPNSTSGTLAPLAYLFAPRGIDPTDCFKTVRSASHQANLIGVGYGTVDVATANTVTLVFARRQNPEIADQIQVIWKSPPLPESSILVRKDIDPAVKEKLKRFFMTYGTAAGPEGDHERKVLDALTYGGFKPVDDSYLDPIRLMVASKDLNEARHEGDAAKVASAQKAFDAINAKPSAHAG
ncbi:MAG TPA: phosphate/phosphite/phosphonate ABC transporter substrate-binding protein [Caulobacteraceae bacterium]